MSFSISLKHDLDMRSFFEKRCDDFYNDQFKNMNIGLPVDVFRIMMSDAINSHWIK